MEHYFSRKPTARERINIIYCSFNSINFTFYTSSSVFSKNKIDKGTALLITESRIKPNSKILDIGCGYGAVGIVLSKMYPDSEITMSDINERALMLAKKNIEINNVCANVISSYLFDNIHSNFDIILANPPQSAGKKLCINLIKDSFYHLNHGASLQLVARHNKGGKSLSEKMCEIFGNVKTISRNSGYHIYYSEKK